MTTSTATPSTLKPTAQQQAFLDALTTTEDHITLRARAGCGKTSAILMGVDAYSAHRPSAEILVCAFNKAIADEVSAKLKARGHDDWRRVQACTLHSLGFGLLKFAYRLTRDDIDDKKVYKLIDRRIERGPRGGSVGAMALRQYREQVQSLVRYAKQAGVGFFDDLPISDVSVWHHLADHFDVNGFDDTTETERVVAAAQAIYRDSLEQTDVVNFDDMILFPLIKSMRVKFTKDVIFLDEAQDLSRSRQALARKFLRPGSGRMVVVGDDRQAIYGFSGADAAALGNLTRELGARVLPLSVTWRCPKAVVAHAQRLVPDLEAAPTAPEGEVSTLDALPDDLGPGDAILCRNTAPLIPLAYSLIRSGRTCKVEGRSIGEGLISLARRWQVTSTDMLARHLDDYRDRETQKALAKGNEAKASEVEDKVATLLEIIAAVNGQGDRTVAGVCRFIESVFADGETGVITLATYHRSKGREWDRVVLWEPWRCPSRAARQDWQLEQEGNLAYVAYTRAKDKLYLVG